MRFPDGTYVMESTAIVERISELWSHPVLDMQDPVHARVDALQTEFVDALYPNPTTGKFSVTFSKALNKGMVSLSDEQGKLVKSFQASGNRVDFDVSSLVTK